MKSWVDTCQSAAQIRIYQQGTEILFEINFNSTNFYLLKPHKIIFAVLKSDHSEYGNSAG